MKISETYLEKLIFKTLISDKNFLPMVNEKFTPQIFVEKVYEDVARFFQKFYQKKGRVPTIQDIKLFANEENLSKSVKEAFLSVKTVDTNEMPKDEMYEYFESYMKKRLALITFKNIFSNYNPNDELDADMLVDKFTKVASLKLIQEDAFDIHRDVETFIDDMTNDEKRLPLGFTDIDKAIGGGLPINGKCLGVVSAPTNTGKSIFLANVAVNACKQGKNVLVISLEMSETLYAQRIYADLYNLPINKIRDHIEDLREGVAKNNCGTMKIKEFPTATLTVRALDGYIEQLTKQGYKFDLICVDYVTLLLAPNADNTNEAGKKNTRELRALSYKYNCPIFTAAQINRDGMGNEPDMKYFADSIAICQDSDLIISLYRQDEDIALGVMRAKILKSRFGEKDKTFNLRFNVENLRFESIENAISAEISEGTAAEAMSGLNEMFG